MAQRASSSGRRTDQGYPTDPPDYPLSRLRRARAIRRAFLGLFLIALLAGAASVFGARTSQVSASGGGYQLSVRYPSVTRPGLAILYVITVRHPGGFPGPIELATTSDYLELFDENGLDPEPASSTTNGDETVWTFDTFDGDELEISFDARTEPARESGASGTTTLTVDGKTLAAVTYRTWVMP